MTPARLMLPGVNAFSFLSMYFRLMFYLVQFAEKIYDNIEKIVQKYAKARNSTTKRQKYIGPFNT
jgi:hypothetical protein